MLSVCILEKIVMAKESDGKSAGEILGTVVIGL